MVAVDVVDVVVSVSVAVGAELADHVYGPRRWHAPSEAWLATSRRPNHLEVLPSKWRYWLAYLCTRSLQMTGVSCIAGL